MSRYNSRSQRWIKYLLPSFLKHNYQKSIDKKVLQKWEREGRPLPPPHIVKVKTIEHYLRKGEYSYLIETGTFMGDMIVSQLENFKKIYSIELSKEYWTNAKIKFKSHSHVELLQGDSGEVMHELIKKIDAPSIFWLDGHYSGGNTAKGSKDSPIWEELEAIFKSDLNHCLLIDDARLFNGSDDYPTLNELNKFILNNKSEARIEIKADTIAVTY